MSTLIVDELYDGVMFNQTVKIKRNLMVAHIRPWIYKHGTLQDGDLRVSVYDGATLLKTSTINYVDINAAFTQDYAHGFIRLDFTALQLNVPETSVDKEYIFRFEMINHTSDAANFISIVRQYENKIYPTYGPSVVDNEASNDFIEPCGLEIYEYKGA